MNPINISNDITQWFSDKSSRLKMVKSFNDAAKLAFVSGVCSFMMKASISRGKSEYKHQFSTALFSGLKLIAYNNGRLTKDDLSMVGMVILANKALVRRLMILGWDTLEIACDNSPIRFVWHINESLMINE